MSALRDPRFRRLFVGQSLSKFGDSALYLSLGIWAKELTGSNGAAGVVFFALGLPSLAAPLAGHLADRVRRRPLMVVTNAITGLLVLSLLLVHTADQLWIIYAVAAVYGASFNVLGAASSGLVKDLVSDADLGGANAAFQTASQGMRIFSPLVGAAIFTTAGGGVLAIFDAATFGVAILALLSVSIEESAVSAEPEPWRTQVTAGFAHLRRSRLLTQVTLATAAVMTVLGCYESAVFAITAALDRSPSFVGVLMSVQGAGSVATGLVVSRLMRRVGEPRTLGVGLGCFAVGALACTSASTTTVFLGVALDGAAMVLFPVAFGTAVQRHTPPRLQGRVGSATGMLLDIPQTASIAAGAALIGVLDYRILLLSVTLVAAVAGGWLLLRPASTRAPASRPAAASSSTCSDQSAPTTLTTRYETPEAS